MRRVLLTAGLLAATGLMALAFAGGSSALQAELGLADHDEADAGPPAPVVLAHIDTGINPYHEAFQTDDPRAQDHPSTYLDGYPETAQALPLTLSAGSVSEGLQVDAAAWGDVDNDTLYYVPGTRIVALKHMGSGGTSCGLTDYPPANGQPPEAPDEAPDAAPSLAEECQDRPFLDDHGHGTMTASRMAGQNSSLADDAFIVSVEGFGSGAVSWAADQSWIDAQSNSWVSFTPPPANQAQDDVDEPDTPLPPLTPNSSTTEAFAEAADDQFVAAASGNGAAYTQGVAPTPTYVLSTAAPNVTLVGAHDNGFVAQWSGAPAHVVADGYAGPVANHTDADGWGPRPIACCTSAAAPYATGAAGAIIQEARSILGDDTTGVEDGIVAEGDDEAVDVGPIADGVLNLTELRTLLYHTAESRPTEGVHDGAVHWAASGDGPGEWAERYGPGANPFCQGCTTSPVPWTEVPEDAPAHEDIGYGAVDRGSVDLARQILHGHVEPVDRPVVDDWFDRDQRIRQLVTQDPPSLTD